MSIPNPFPPTSRYSQVEIADMTLPDGSKVSFLRRRFVPDPRRFVTFTLHTVAQGDRLDRLTFQYLGDSLQFWRIADANGVLHPDDLEQLERLVRITLPEGLPGVPRA
jgi:nucleoid-associated protein YgaU